MTCFFWPIFSNSLAACQSASRSAILSQIRLLPVTAVIRINFIGLSNIVVEHSLYLDTGVTSLITVITTIIYHNTFATCFFSVASFGPARPARIHTTQPQLQSLASERTSRPPCVSIRRPPRSVGASDKPYLLRYIRSIFRHELEADSFLLILMTCSYPPNIQRLRRDRR